MAGMRSALEKCNAAEGLSFRGWDDRGTWAGHVVDASSHRSVAEQGAMTGLDVTIRHGKGIDPDGSGTGTRVRICIMEEDKGMAFDPAKALRELRGDEETPVVIDRNCIMQ